MNNKEIWIAGSNSYLGGADTELGHNMVLWRENEIEVHVVPMGGNDLKIKSQMEKIGCIYHNYSPDIFKDKVVISYCNGIFLSSLKEIVQKGKPKKVLFANCMTYLFPLEIEAHKNKWIDKFIFVSNYQKSILKPQLEKLNPVDELIGYKPYFDPNNTVQEIKFEYRPPQNWFSLGRVSRDDGAKYSSDMWNIFYKVCTPKQKKVFILGFGDNAKKKCGPPPNGLDWQTWSANAIPVKQFYNIIHCIIHKTGGSRESYSRIVPEAYGFGVPFICEKNYAFPDLVQDGITGYMCSSSDEMSYRASELAFDEQKRKKMIYNAYDFLVNEIASREKCYAPWKRLFEE